MLREEASTTINAPADRIYNSLVDPANLARMLRGNLADVSNIRPLPTGGYAYEWTYKVAGFPIKASAAMVECVPSERIVVESEGGMKTISTWVFRQEENATLATFSIESPIDNPFLRRLSELFIRNQLRFAVDIAVANLKFLIEQDIARESGTDKTAP
jgi:hypothetical protein